jgi:hypothetical protein
LSDEFRTVMGIVQFPPRDGEAGGKAVRNITVRQTGFGPTAVKVSATLWPSHEHVAVEEGSVVILEGKYKQNKGEKDGETVTYHNLSVTRIAVLGQADSGKKVDVENETAAEPESDDDIPF